MALIVEPGNITEVHALPIIVLLEYPNTDMVPNEPFSMSEIKNAIRDGV